METAQIILSILFTIVGIIYIVATSEEITFWSIIMILNITLNCFYLGMIATEKYKSKPEYNQLMKSYKQLDSCSTGEIYKLKQQIHIQDSIITKHNNKIKHNDTWK